MPYWPATSVLKPFRSHPYLDNINVDSGFSSILSISFLSSNNFDKIIPELALYFILVIFLNLPKE